MRYESKSWKRIQQYGEKLKNWVIQSEEFNVIESQRSKVSVLINHHQVWFLCLNGTSTLFRLFNAKAILIEEQ